MSGNRSMKVTTCYFDREQYTSLRLLSRYTKIPMAALIREGIDYVLERRDLELKKALKARESHAAEAAEVSGSRD